MVHKGSQGEPFAEKDSANFHFETFRSDLGLEERKTSGNFKTKGMVY
jgi:hypothetical protein